MTRFAPIAALLAVAVLTGDLFAQSPGRARRPNAPKAGADAPKRPGVAGRDPAQFVTRIIQQFDKDGDRKLDAKELTAMLTAMRDRRGGAAGRPGARPGQPGKPGAARGRRPGGDKPARPGGELPKRPKADGVE